MSAPRLLSRLSFGRTIRSIRIGSRCSALPLGDRSCEGIRKFGSSFRSSTHKTELPTTGVAKQVRFYSSDGLVKSAGNMRIAIIGQSMFGQEVSLIYDGGTMLFHAAVKFTPSASVRICHFEVFNTYLYQFCGVKRSWH